MRKNLTQLDSLLRKLETAERALHTAEYQFQQYGLPPLVPIREQYGLTGKDLSEIMQCDKSTIYRMEQGSHQPSLENVRRYRDAILTIATQPHPELTVTETLAESYEAQREKYLAAQRKHCPPIGTLIQAIRKHQKKTRDELGALAGISSSVLFTIERSTIHHPTERLREIYQLLVTKPRPIQQPTTPAPPPAPDTPRVFTWLTVPAAARYAGFSLTTIRSAITNGLIPTTVITDRATGKPMLKVRLDHLLAWLGGAHTTLSRR